MRVWNTAKQIIYWLWRHVPTHEDGGIDELSLTGLSGDPADTINESLLTTQNDIIVRGASAAERLNIAASRIVARLASGNVVAATVAQIGTLLGKAAASGLASLNSSTKVVEQPASITDHLDGSPDEDDATKAPTSEWAFDHDASSAKHMDALLSAQGDIITRDASVPKRLAKGNEYELLSMGASEPEWGDSEALLSLLRGSQFAPVSTAAAWYESLTGDGGVTQEPMRNFVVAGTNGSDTGSALLYTSAYGFYEGAEYNYIDFSKKLYLIFNYARKTSNATAVARVQFSRASIEGELWDIGFGMRVDNLAAKGVSYNGSGLATVNLNVTFVHDQQYQIVIILYPGSKIEWWIDGVLKGTQSDTNYFPPSASSGIALNLHHSIISGVTQTRAYSLFMLGKIWQER